MYCSVYVWQSHLCSPWTKFWDFTSLALINWTLMFAIFIPVTQHSSIKDWICWSMGYAISFLGNMFFEQGWGSLGSQGWIFSLRDICDTRSPPGKTIFCWKTLAEFQKEGFCSVQICIITTLFCEECLSITQLKSFFSQSTVRQTKKSNSQPPERSDFCIHQTS